ncbi:MAG: sodium-dependent transporter, partial [Myxococcota bacterium]
VGDAGRALSFVFEPDFSKLTGESILAAISQAFFSVSVAMGLLIVYGSYLPKEVNIPKASITIASADTLVAVLAGLAIFPVVFANSMEPGQGPGLAFITLPIAFGEMPGGTIFGTIFFALLTFAALTSSIATLEPLVSWAGQKYGIARRRAALLFGGAAWIVGLLTVLSFNVLNGVHPLGMIKAFEGKTIFDLVEFLAETVLLTTGGLFIALFAGWAMSATSTRDELSMEEGPLFAGWRVMVRFVAPGAIAVVIAATVYGLATA